MNRLIAKNLETAMVAAVSLAMVALIGFEISSAAVDNLDKLELLKGALNAKH